MQHRRDVILTQPALIPIAGNFDRKPRSLDRDVTTVGRARGTDLCLEANEISTLHCIFYRTADGYRVRDCNSRCGTRVNGETVKNQTLHDGDIVNLGPFSFEFRLPATMFPRDGVKLDPLKVEHWKNSRRKLAQFALKMRMRVRGQSPREQEWVQRANLLKDKIRSYDQRLSELEGAEKELTQEREQIARELEKHRHHVQLQEGQLAKRFEEADKDIRQRWQEFQQRCQAEEGRLVPARPLTEDAAAAQLRQELNAERERLGEFEEQVTRQQDFLQREQQEFSTMKEQWVKAQTKSSVAVEEQQAMLAQQEAAVRAQKAELMRMMGELKKMQDDLRKQPKPDTQTAQELERLRQENAELRSHADGNASGAETQALLQENEELRAALLELQQQFEQSAGSANNTEVMRQVTDLRAEVELLSEELTNKENILSALQQQDGTPDEDANALRAENEALKKLVTELTQADKEAPKTENDLERYETELNELSRQLEGDRGKLNKELAMVRERNKEFEETIREMEMEMSKERAELGRERMRLERIREEVKGDTERLQRELAVRDSMAPVQKLRDELMQKQAPTGKADKPLTDRLRSMRNQLTDSPAAGS